MTRYKIVHDPPDPTDPAEDSFDAENDHVARSIVTGRLNAENGIEVPAPGRLLSVETGETIASWQTLGDIEDL
jgi:hypothetical protein